MALDQPKSAKDYGGELIQNTTENKRTQLKNGISIMDNTIDEILAYIY